MDETPLYQKIAEAIRRDILEGRIKTGDRLPPVRKMTTQWGCTIGTVQHAYQELASQGLVVSRAGQGTRVAAGNFPQANTALRRAALVHRAESFLLEVLPAGYTPSEVEEAIRQAMDRWRVMQREPIHAPGTTLEFTGSHDLVITWLASHFSEIAPGNTLSLRFTGSLGGLIALAEGKAEIAGSHLWDEESDTYNAPFVRRLLPGQHIALITLAHRRMGLIVPPGNPRRISSLADLSSQPDLRFVNRQPGSGTRVWLDATLRQAGISAAQVKGYTAEKMTHSDVARAVAEGEADTGLGLEASAHAYSLGFILLTCERYDLVVTASGMEHPAVQALTRWLQQDKARQIIGEMPGYDTGQTGRVVWVET